jgi:hypothetical protein
MIESYARLLGKNIELKTPIMYYEKHEIIQELQNEKLIDKVWFCESPTEVGKRCGRCVSCQHFKNATVQLAIKDFDDEEILAEVLKAYLETKNKNAQKVYVESIKSGEDLSVEKTF